MSLKIWLPMAGDTRNLGTFDTGIIINNYSYVKTIHNISKLGKSLQFLGNSNSCLSLGYLDSIIGAGKSFTIAFWINSQNTGARGAIFSCYVNATSGGLNIEQNSSSSTTSNNVRIYMDNGAKDILISNTTLTNNAWVHIAITYTPGTLKVYKNGALVSTTSYTLATTPSQVYRIGSDGRSGGLPMKMHMNDFRIYDEELSAKEVEILSRGLVYRCDGNALESLDFDVYDYSNQGTNLCYTNSSGYGGRNPYGKAATYNVYPTGYNAGMGIHFDGSGTNRGSASYLSSPLINMEGFKNSYTISWWSCSGNTTSGNMISRMQWGLTNCLLNPYPSGATVWCWNTGDSADNPLVAESGKTIPYTYLYDCKWHHYAMTGDGTTGKLYVDGVQVAHATTYLDLCTKGAKTKTAVNGLQRLIISGWGTGNAYRWWGGIGDLRLYSTCLSAAAISEIYTAPKKEISINKRGQLKSTKFIECVRDDAWYLKYAKDLSTGLRSTGVQGINTRFVTPTTGISMIIDVTPVAASTASGADTINNILGCEATTTNTLHNGGNIMIRTTSTNTTTPVFNFQAGSSGSFTWNTRHVIKIKKDSSNKVTAVLDGTTVVNAVAGSINSTDPIYIFTWPVYGYNESLSKRGSNMILHSCRIFNDASYSRLVRDFQPVQIVRTVPASLSSNGVEIAIGKKCLYDRVTKLFYPNIGTGDFS